MDKYEVGIVGLGWPGERHAEGIQGSGLGRLYAACDLNEARRAKFAAKFSPEKVFGDYDEMLADPELDAVVVSMPNALHFPRTLKALQAGKHVLCEKPPTLNARANATITRRSRETGIGLFFWPANAFFRLGARGAESRRGKTTR